MPFLDKTIQKRIEQKLKRLNALRPLPKSAVQKLQQQFQIEMTYNSNSIEGNSLTLKETFLVINEGITIKGKPLKDHLEAKDHTEALEWLYSEIQAHSRHTISEMFIRNIHALVVHNTDKEWAGRYRNSNVIIGGAKHNPPDAIEVPNLMNQFVQWIRKNQKISIIELAALAHHRLVHIHPFFDGNGRTARLFMNVLTMQKGYPLVIILKNDRKKYYDVLAQADNEHYKPLVIFIAQAIERSLDLYLKVLTPSHQPREKFYPLSEIAPKTPYSAKYLNLLLRQGKLEGHKEGRDWVVSKEAIERYRDGRKRKR
ncbi:MAG: Fic family protein [Candidatus Kerfeldbacteria bacterium]|nr:Fic family protein [Candidatus Kerfeldbacteria bacterium]